MVATIAEHDTYILGFDLGSIHHDGRYDGGTIRSKILDLPCLHAYGNSDLRSCSFVHYDQQGLSALDVRCAGYALGDQVYTPLRDALEEL